MQRLSHEASTEAEPTQIVEGDNGKIAQVEDSGSTGMSRYVEERGAVQVTDDSGTSGTARTLGLKITCQGCA